MWLNFQVYYSEETHLIFVEAIAGKCEVRKKNDIPACNAPAIFQHIFFCEHLHDPSKGSLKQVISPFLPNLEVLLFIIFFFFFWEFEGFKTVLITSVPFQVA